MAETSLFISPQVAAHPQACHRPGLPSGPNSENHITELGSRGMILVGSTLSQWRQAGPPRRSDCPAVFNPRHRKWERSAALLPGCAGASQPSGGSASSLSSPSRWRGPGLRALGREASPQQRLGDRAWGLGCSPRKAGREETAALGHCTGKRGDVSFGCLPQVSAEMARPTRVTGSLPAAKARHSRAAAPMRSLLPGHAGEGLGQARGEACPLIFSGTWRTRLCNSP